ncbi:carbon-nitrogen hydrolase family protein [Brevibacillus fluminis]|uniref:Carbon-nitrogen hydrolase family protein n=1 Tax=Brevibacillus fluminis TaxID=511487 RepID=A0A3M8DSI9_9BACL|nr:carbon-nitrogen hydrolase family protein [Brevibacillus fluminis]RNB89937.1 carbon-nitrogen hydrolase family protein [Brevibacillus fluminis]
MSTISIALAQLRCELRNKELNLQRILQALEEAAEKKADYVLFPELYLTGYDMSDQLLLMAETEDGPSIMRIREHAKRFRVGAIVGFPEREGDKLYNCALFIGKHGEIIGKYRKVHLYHKEKEWFAPGDILPVFTLPEGKIGLMITYDMEFPEAARVLALGEADLILVLAANMIPYQHYQDIYLHARALENHLFTAAANMVGLDSENVFFGESQVVHPSGFTVYKAGNNESIPVCVLNLEEINQEQPLLDYLNNRRHSVYQKEQRY